MSSGQFSEEELIAAVEALADQERFRGAESAVVAAAPELQRVLLSALEAGGWFDEAHQGELLKAATTPDPDERLTAVRTMLAEEARVAMMVGVAVGWTLHDELSGEGESDKRTPGEPANEEE